MIACGGNCGENRRQVRLPLDGRADGHELDQPAKFVDVRLDPHHVVGADCLGFVGNQPDGMFAGGRRPATSNPKTSPRGEGKTT